MSSKNYLNKTLPQARTKDIVVQDIENEILVYDLKNNKAHHLSETASLVWKYCDGKTDTGYLTDLLTKKLNTKIENDFIWLALVELGNANLLENNLIDDDLTRRDVLLRYALPAIAFPIITSLITPKAVQASSNCTPTGERGCLQSDCCDTAAFCSAPGNDTEGTCVIFP